MKTNKLLCAFATLLISIGWSNNTYAQYEWDNDTLPSPGIGMEWVLQDSASDEFNYGSKNAAFYGKWFDYNPAGWTGPGETIFKNDHIMTYDSKLVVEASRIPVAERIVKTENNVDYTTMVYTGYATTKTRIRPPVYFEAKMKCNSMVTASNFWAKLGDIDNKTEIDVTESYAGGPWANQPYQMNTNWHDFRNGNQSDQKLYHNSILPVGWPGRNVKLNEDYFTFGCYWKDEGTIEWYMNGYLVRTVNQGDMTTDFDEGLRIIFDVESHNWLVNQGLSPTDAELADPTKNKMYVEWVRTYKAVVANDAISLANVPTIMESTNSYTIDVDYTASGSKEISLSLWDGGTWLANTVSSVTAGSGTQAMTINLANALPEDTDYKFKVHIRPVGTTWQEATANDELGNISVVINNNLVQNPGFETGDIQNWTYWGGTVPIANNAAWTYRSDLWGAEVVGSGAIEQVITGLIPNTTYTFKGWAKVVTSGNIVKLGVKEFGGADQSVSITNAWWTEGSITFTTGATNTSAKIFMWMTTPGGTARGDDFSVELGSGARVGSQSATSGNFITKAYPNPVVNGNLHIDVHNGAEQVSVRMINMQGQTVLSEIIASDIAQVIDTDAFNKGLYILEIKSGERTDQHRLTLK